ncbi:MAG TPA: glycosyltransferase family 4 protein [bacterium]|jgi:glycosyltransferase involved in cell wall biosynthesis|nr:glycosyltransferase family 4 protein [bacterium]
MKKIIFFANNNVGTGFSGGDRIFIEFLKNWKDKADLILFGSEEAIGMAEKRGVDVKFIQTDKINPSMPGGITDFISHTFRRTFKGLSSVKQNKKNVEDADYIYSVSDFYPDFIPALYVKLKNPKIKWIAGYYLFAPNPFSKESTYKGKQWLRGFLYWFTQLFSHFFVKRFADYVFVTNEPDRNRFVSRRLSEEKVVAIRGGVDIDIAKSVPNGGEKLYDAVFIGRFHPTKGVIELIDIWRIVCDEKPGSKLGLIGVGGLEKEMKFKVKSLGLENNVDFLGFVDGIDKYKIFKKSRIALYPAVLDHWSMAPVEAMSAGLPLVTFDVGTLKHLSPEGMIRVPCYDTRLFAKGILDLLEDEKLYQKMKNESLHWAERWDWKVRSEEIFNLLN